jgi:hypothetical protein
MLSDELGPIEPTMAPLLLSIGRAVLGAAALEKVLLVEIARRHADRDGFTADLDEALSRLERRPAGALLRELERLDLDDGIAARISELIERRNRLVHGFMEDSDVIEAIERGTTASLVERVDRLAIDCQLLLNELTPTAFGGLERIFGVPLERLLDVLLSIDPETVTDERLRAQLAVVHAANVEELRAALGAET